MPVVILVARALRWAVRAHAIARRKTRQPWRVKPLPFSKSRSDHCGFFCF